MSGWVMDQDDWSTVAHFSNGTYSYKALGGLSAASYMTYMTNDRIKNPKTLLTRYASCVGLRTKSSGKQYSIGIIIIAVAIDVDPFCPRLLSIMLAFRPLFSGVGFLQSNPKLPKPKPKSELPKLAKKVEVPPRSHYTLLSS